MTTTIDGFMHQQLLDRRDKLQQAVRHNRDFADLQHLLKEVDSALARMDAGSYGICETCHDPIELDRLISDPLVRFCLDHLTPPERTALERDLELAAQVQKDSYLLLISTIRVGTSAITMNRPVSSAAITWTSLMRAQKGCISWLAMFRARALRRPCS